MCCNPPGHGFPEELPISSTPIKEVAKKSKKDNTPNQSANKTHKVGVPEIAPGTAEFKPEITKVSIPAGATKSLTHAGLALCQAAVESIQTGKKSKILEDNQEEIKAKSIQQVPKKHQKSLIERLIPQPAEVRQLILKGLSVEELTSLEIALASSPIDAWNQLAVFVKKVRDQIILDNLLLDHPNWVNQVTAWKDIAVEDKIWLIRLYELYRLNTTIPQIDNLYPKFDSSSDISILLKRFTFNISETDKLGFAQYSYRLSQIPTERTPELLKQKNEINEMLNTYLTLCVPLGTQLDSNKLPDAIYLLKNLKRLCIHHREKLESLPNLKAFKKLEELQIDNTPLASPPNTSHNEQLKSIVLKGCNLMHAPNVSNNPNLNTLILDDNNLKEPPDISNNPALEGLAIRNNMLTTPPNLKKNPNLKTVNLRNNRLIESPDTSNNEKLECLYLMNNEITEFPNIKNNKKLKELHLDNNRLTLRVFQ